MDRSIRETLGRAVVAAHSQVLDVGCGSGELLDRIPARLRVGADLSFGMALGARHKLSGQAHVVNADVAALPFGDERFDVILSSSSFHFWADRRAALAEIRRVLRRRGHLVMTDWCDDFLTCRLCNAFLRWRDASRPAIATSGECATLLRNGGFDVLSVDRYKISWLWGLMTVIALRR